MKEKMIFVLFLSLCLTSYAGVVTDDFSVSHDYNGGDTSGTIWDAVLNYNEGTVINSGISNAGVLTLESANQGWENTPWDSGLSLVKLVEGDFIAEVEVVAFNDVTWHDKGLMARVPNVEDAGPAEDIVIVKLFGITGFPGNGFRMLDDGVQSDTAVPAAYTFLQLERRGNTFYGRYKQHAGHEWIDLVEGGLEREDLDGLALQVGIWHATFSDNRGFAQFDNFKLTTPWNASNPNPHNAIDIDPSDVTLSWDAAADAPGPIVNHILYYGTNATDVSDSTPEDPNGDTVVVTLPVETTQYELPELEYDTRYFWRVDEYINDPNISKGNIWKFDTQKALPDVLTQPQDQYVFAGEMAEFNVEVSSMTTVSYQWYKDEVLLTGETNFNLTIFEAGLGDIGWYYCEVTNAAGAISSATVQLEIKRLAGHWELNGDLLDISGRGNHGDYPDPNFVTDAPGASGKQSLQFYGDGQYITIPNEEQFDFYEMVSASFWLKGNDFGSWIGFVGKNLGSDEGWLLFNYQNSGHIRVTTKGGNGDITSTESVSDGQWHHVVGVFDGSTGERTIYIDGKLDIGATGTPGPICTPTDEPLVIGMQTSPDYTMNGLMSDVQIYNYAIDAYKVAELYTTVMGGRICVEYPQFDFNEDCEVNLGDFAIFADQWLKSNWVGQ